MRRAGIALVLLVAGAAPAAAQISVTASEVNSAAFVTVRSTSGSLSDGRSVSEMGFQNGSTSPFARTSTDGLVSTGDGFAFANNSSLIDADINGLRYVYGYSYQAFVFTPDSTIDLSVSGGGSFSFDVAARTTFSADSLSTGTDDNFGPQTFTYQLSGPNAFSRAGVLAPATPSFAAILLPGSYSFSFMTTPRELTVTDFAIGGNSSILRFTGVAAGAAPVPEPSAWAVMIAGIGGAGAALRRRRQGTSALA